MNCFRSIRWSLVIHRTLIVLLLVSACNRDSVADVFGLFKKSEQICCDSMPCEYCDDGCDALGQKKETSCFDPWLPRSCLGLPLLKGLAEQRGATLPPPIGASYVLTVLQRNVAVSDIRIGLGANPPQSLQRFSVDNFTTSSVNQLVRGDVWVLPCLNLYGVVGQTQSKGDLVATVEECRFYQSCLANQLSVFYSLS